MEGGVGENALIKNRVEGFKQCLRMSVEWINPILGKDTC
jgi:hypothetical protein